MKITILTPVYNDWKSASKLIEELNTIVKDLDAEFSLVIVNDASTEEKPTSIFNTENLLSVEIFDIRNNQGHGKSIAIGLKHIFQNKEF
jgi:Glycosyltransferases involved in cell wall biogenesis